MLLVDDSPVVLRALKGLFARDHRFQVVGTATDGHQAVLAAASLNPQLVLMDLHLPHLDGAEATRCLKQSETPPVVFMITSDDSIAARALSAAAGADIFLIKSGDLARKLEANLQEWFGPNHPPRPGAASVPTCKSPSPATPSPASAQ